MIQTGFFGVLVIEDRSALGAGPYSSLRVLLADLAADPSLRQNGFPIGVVGYPMTVRRSPGFVRKEGGTDRRC